MRTLVLFTLFVTLVSCEGEAELWIVRGAEEGVIAVCAGEVAEFELAFSGGCGGGRDACPRLEFEVVHAGLPYSTEDGLGDAANVSVGNYSEESGSRVGTIEPLRVGVTRFQISAESGELYSSIELLLAAVDCAP